MRSDNGKSRLAAAPEAVELENWSASDSGGPLKALRAQDLLDLAPLLHYLDFVQVGLELPSGGLHRKTSVAPKSSRLAAMVTLGHTTGSFLTVLQVCECGCNGTTGKPIHRPQPGGVFNFDRL